MGIIADNYLVPTVCQAQLRYEVGTVMTPILWIWKPRSTGNEVIAQCHRAGTLRPYLKPDTAVPGQTPVILSPCGTACALPSRT